jgi:hypothetical protein
MGMTQLAFTVPDTMRISIIMVMADITGSIIITVPIIINGPTRKDITHISIISHTANTIKNRIIREITIINAIIINGIIINETGINEITTNGTIANEVTTDVIILKKAILKAGNHTGEASDLSGEDPGGDNV